MSNLATLSTKRWTREQALAFGAKGRETQRQLAAQHRAERKRLSDAVASVCADSRLPLPERVDDLISRCVTALAKGLFAPKAERLARIIQHLSQAQRNLANAHSSAGPAIASPDAPAQP